MQTVEVRGMSSASVVLSHVLCIEFSLEANAEDEMRVSHSHFKQLLCVIFICFHF